MAMPSAASRVQQQQIIDAALAAVRTRSVGPTRPLGRRHRWELLSLDVNDDVAVVAVARRGKRKGLTAETHRFVRRAEGWEWDGSGPALSFDEPTPPRRSAEGSDTWSSSSSDETIWIWQLVENAAWVRLDGRTRPVPDHGFIVTIGDGKRRRFEVLDTSGSVLGLLADDRPLLPRHVRALSWLHGAGRAKAGGWFSCSPDDARR
jgi:hypothetical protein